MLTLDDLQVGQSALIQSIQDDTVLLQSLRMGISVGVLVTCIAKIPSGPTVIQRGSMELAMGQPLCQGIEVLLQ